MLSFIVQRSFVTINSQCRAFMAVKKLKVSVNHHFVKKNTLHILSVRPEQATFTRMYSIPVQPDIWPLLICEWFEMFEAHSWHCLQAAAPGPGPALFCLSLVCGGGGGGSGGPRGKFDLKILTEGHTTSRDVTVITRQDKNLHSIQMLNLRILNWNVSILISLLFHQLSLLKTIFCLFLFPSPRLWSEPQHDKWQVRHLHSPLLSPQLRLKNIGSSQERLESRKIWKV